MEKTEYWKVIPLTNGKYEASDRGFVRRIKGNILKMSPDGRGYLQVCIKYNDKVQTIAVHRLIARSFLTSFNGAQINHIDGIKTNNYLSNLEYVTGTDNIRHAFENDLIKTRKPVLQYDLSMNFIKEWQSLHSVKVDGGYNFGHVSSVCSGKRKTHSNYIWRWKTGQQK